MWLAKRVWPSLLRESNLETYSGARFLKMSCRFVNNMNLAFRKKKTYILETRRETLKDNESSK